MSETTETTVTTEAAEKADVKTVGNNWTVMIYMAGDNNLSTDMVYALEQLKSVAEGKPEIKLFVYYDGSSTDVPTLYCDFSQRLKSSGLNNEIEFFQSNKIKNKLIDVPVEFNENSAAVDNILNFVSWCVNRNSDEEINQTNYAFIFSGHTFGFVNKGLFKDEKANYYMTYSKLKYMFERITWTKAELETKADADEAEFYKLYGRHWSKNHRLERTTQILGKSLDLLGFDTCVMSTLEVGCQFRKFAKTMVASEGSIPTAGWNYAQILVNNIAGENPVSPQTMAINFVNEFIKQQNKFALADISVDISAWDLEKLPSLENDFEKLADDLLNCFKDEKSSIYYQMRRLIAYVHWQCQTYLLEQHIDLGDFCQILIKEIDLLLTELTDENSTLVKSVSDSCRKVLDRIRECVMLTGFSGSDFQFSNGISLFFPWSWASYLAASEDYNKLTFINDNPAGKSWNKFLLTYLSEVTLRVPEPLTIAEEITPEIVSVIYESYDLKNDLNSDVSGDSHTSVMIIDGKQFPNSSKQFPNSSKQFPNSSKQFPNGPRLNDEFSVFLARFMKLKNNLSNWNRAGFTSKTVTFQPELILPTASAASTQPPKTVIKIPVFRVIKSIRDEIANKLDEIKHNYPDSSNIENLKNKLTEVLNKSDITTANKILKSLRSLNLLKSNNLTEADLKSGVDNAFSILKSAK